MTTTIKIMTMRTMVVINSHLSGEKDGPEVNKEDVGGGGGVARPQDGDDVGDAQQRDYHLGKYIYIHHSHDSDNHDHNQDGDDVGDAQQWDDHLG